MSGAIAFSSVPGPMPAEQLERVVMNRTANDLLQIMAGTLPAGFSEWAEEYRPDTARYLREAEAGLRAAVFAGDAKGFAEAVAECVGKHLRSVYIYEKSLKAPRRMTYSGVLRVFEG